MTMIVGVDFDNTIVCYDRAFHKAACEQGLIPSDIPATKEKVKQYLINIGQEDRWTELQGYVYGSRMDTVETFTGVVECFKSLINQGVSVYIISHKTRYPYRGNRYDLHDAARNWLTASGFLNHAGLSMDQVFFELTKENKLARIAAVGCTHFIDDLPEIFCAESFPVKTVRILFAPGYHAVNTAMLSFASWKEIAEYFKRSNAC